MRSGTSEVRKMYNTSKRSKGEIFPHIKRRAMPKHRHMPSPRLDSVTHTNHLPVHPPISLPTSDNRIRPCPTSDSPHCGPRTSTDPGPVSPFAPPSPPRFRARPSSSRSPAHTARKGTDGRINEGRRRCLSGRGAGEARKGWVAEGGLAG